MDKTYKPAMESVEADRLYGLWQGAVGRTLTGTGEFLMQ